MTDENGTDEHERSLADLLGFDPADERTDDVTDAARTGLHALLNEAIGDEPETTVSPLAVIAAARRESDTATVARRDRERGRRRHGVHAATSAEHRGQGRVDRRGRGLRRGRGARPCSAARPRRTPRPRAPRAPRVPPRPGGRGDELGRRLGQCRRAGACCDLGGRAIRRRLLGCRDLRRELGGCGGPSRHPLGRRGAGRDIARILGAHVGAPRRQVRRRVRPGRRRSRQPPASAESALPPPMRVTAGTTCVWPELDAAAVAAALHALDLPGSTPVRQPVRAVCAADQVGAVTIPSAGVTVLVARDDALTSDPQYGYSTARATATGAGITVLVAAHAVLGRPTRRSRLRPAGRRGQGRAGRACS